MTARRSAVPLLVAVALLLPLIYVGSYFALVVPRGRFMNTKASPLEFPKLVHYRLAPAQSAVIFWPLEQLDRKLRPKVWVPHWPGMQLDVF